MNGPLFTKTVVLLGFNASDVSWQINGCSTGKGKW